MTNQFCQLHLTCRDTEEADKIADALLAKQLIVCAKKMPVKSKFRWQGKIEDKDEVLLSMESREDLFDKVEAEVANIHSYSTFVLESVPIGQISSKAQEWVDDELDGSE